MKRIYFDAAATTPLNKGVLRELRRDLKRLYGNPSSLYLEGRTADYFVNLARNKISLYLGCEPSEIFFTSGASESNSWVAKCSRYQLVATKDSHSSLDNFKDVERDISKKVLISFPLVNNETGKVNYDMLKKVKRCHLDITQALGKVKIDLHSNKKIKFASASAHKIGGLKGCGILYIRKSEQRFMKSLIDGHQENGLRGGTENVLGIISFGKAMEKTYKNWDKNVFKVKRLVDGLYEDLFSCDIYKIQKNNNIINLTFKKVQASTAVAMFDSFGVCVSASSACNSGDDKPSQALIEAGYNEDEALRTIRISLSPDNHKWECKKFVKICKHIIDYLEN